MRLQERLLRLPLVRDHEARARVAGPHQKQADLEPLPADLDHRLAPVDLRLHARLVHLRHEHLIDRVAQLPPPATDVLAHGRLRDVGAVLREEPLPDPLRGVPLLPRRLTVREKPRVDQRPIRAQLRRRTPHRLLARRRQRSGERLPHRTPMHTVAARQLADRQALPRPVPTDLLEQLHPRSHPLCDLPSELVEARTVDSPSDEGGAKSSRRSGANSDRRAHHLRPARTENRPAAPAASRAHQSDTCTPKAASRPARSTSSGKPDPAAPQQTSSIDNEIEESQP